MSHLFESIFHNLNYLPTINHVNWKEQDRHNRRTCPKRHRPRPEFRLGRQTYRSRMQWQEHKDLPKAQWRLGGIKQHQDPRRISLEGQVGPSWVRHYSRNMFSRQTHPYIRITKSVEIIDIKERVDIDSQHSREQVSRGHKVCTQQEHGLVSGSGVQWRLSQSVYCRGSTKTKRVGSSLQYWS